MFSQTPAIASPTGGDVRSACCAKVFLVFLVSSANCPALEVTLTGDARAAQEYDTNIFRTLRPHKAAWGQGVDGSIGVAAADVRWDSHLDARFANRWYVTDNNLDYFNQLFNWASKYRSERVLWKFDTQYNRDTTLTSDSDITADVGYVFNRIPRTTRILSPSVGYSLSDYTLLNLSYEYRDTAYETKPTDATRVVDSQAHTGALSLSHQWNEHLTLLATASYTDYLLKGSTQSLKNRLIPLVIGGVVIPAEGTYLIPAVDSSIRTSSLMAGFNFAASETLTLAFSGGAQYNQTSTPAFTQTTLIGGDSQGPSFNVPALSNDAITEVFTANAHKRFEHSDIGFDYSRSVSPNLQGTLLSYDRYALTGKHKFSDRLSTSLTLSYSEQSSPTSDSSTASNRQIYTARTSVNWQWDRNWMVNAAYQYTQVNYAGNSSAADSHGIFLTLRYLFDQHTL